MSDQPTQQTPQPPPQKDTNLDMLVLIYVMYLAAMVVGLTAPIALGLAYYYKGEASPWMATHYIYLIHTFWKGLLIAVISLAIASVAGPVILMGIFGWWVIRCVMGLKAVADKKPIQDPETWLF